MGQKDSLGCSFVPKRTKFGKKWLSYGHFPFERLHDSIKNHMGQNRMLGFSHLYQTDPKLIKKWLSYGQFPPERCDSMENHKGQKRSFSVHLCQKYPKLVQKWLSYGYFPTEKGYLLVVIFTKNIKIGQEMAELWPFSHWEVAWFHWEPHGTKEDPMEFGSHLYQKRTKVFQEMAQLWPFSKWEVE